MIRNFSFIFMRHGQTEANVNGLCSGAYCTSSLTPEGQNQIASASETLNSAGIIPDVIYASPTSRTQQSSEVFRRHRAYAQMQPILLDGLRERHMGSWEGVPYEHVKSQLARGMIGEGGETKAAFQERLHQALMQISSNSHTLPLIISHGFVWQALHDIYGTEAPWIENANLFQVTWQDFKLSSKKIPS